MPRQVNEIDARVIEESRAAFAGDNASLAPGGPGTAPHWAPGGKEGVGTALGGSSLTWFTIGQGILNEVFYPRIDQACIRDLGLVVTDGNDFVSEERSGTRTAVSCPHEGVPLYQVKNTCRQGRYRIEKTILAHPEQDVVLQFIKFVPLEGTIDDYQVYALINPMLGRRGEFAPDDAWLGEHRGVPMLFATGKAARWPWRARRGGSPARQGLSGASDGWLDLSRNKRLTKVYGRAEGGNVAPDGQIELTGTAGGFTLAWALASIQRKPHCTAPMHC